MGKLDLRGLILRRYKVSLEADSPIRVGAAGDPFRGVSNPVVRVGDRLVIPGSSFKGALRNQLERYFIKEAEARGDDVLKPCLAAARESKFESELIEKERRYVRSGCKLEEGKRESICPVCYFLGAQSLLGFVRVSFLTGENLQADVLTGIAIDRKTGTAREKAKYEYEIIPEGSHFEGFLEIVERDEYLGWEFGKARYFSIKRKDGGFDTFTPDEWLERFSEFQGYDNLFNILKQCVEAIRLIGGYKSRGAGDVTVKLVEI